MKLPTNRLDLAVWLAVLAYFGFYVFGVIMGVYAPWEVPYLTIPFLLMLVGVVIYFVRTRGNEPDPATDGAIHEARKMRERRGF